MNIEFYNQKREAANYNSVLCEYVCVRLIINRRVFPCMRQSTDFIIKYQ